MKKFFSDFKAFIAKGNIVDMAVGVVIGGAFGKIVTSLVNDIIMPSLSLITGGASISNMKYVLTAAELDPLNPTKIIKPEVAIKYGNFIQLIIDFLLVAFCIFCVLRVMLKANQKLHAKEIAEAEAKAKAEEEKKKAEEEAAAQAAAEKETVEDILRDIRESLKK